MATLFKSYVQQWHWQDLLAVLPQYEIKVLTTKNTTEILLQYIGCLICHHV
jgi:hypothetical protein